MQTPQHPQEAGIGLLRPREIIEPLSHSWRISGSNNKPVELALIIKSLEKILSHMMIVGAAPIDIRFNVGDKSYTGKPDRIRVSPEFALRAGVYPIPTDNFDVLVGLVAHEAAHIRVESLNIRTIDNTISAEDRLYNKIATVGEEIYTDQWVKRMFPPLYRYLYKSREAYRNSNFDWNNLFSAWCAVSVYREILPDTVMGNTSLMRRLNILLQGSQNLYRDMFPRDRERLYHSLATSINQLNESEALKSALGNTTLSHLQSQQPPAPGTPGSGQQQGQNPGAGTGADSRGKVRTEITSPIGKAIAEVNLLYPGRRGQQDNQVRQLKQQLLQDQQAAPEYQLDESVVLEKESHNPSRNISKVTVPPEGASQKATQATQATRKTGQQQEQNEVENLITITEELADTIENLLESEIEDVTEEIQDLVRHHVKSTTYQVATTPVTPDLDKRLSQELTWLKQLLNSRGYTTERARQEGRPDASRLHRVATDGLLFKERKAVETGKQDIVVLVDASDSMDTRQELYQAVYAIGRLLPRTQVLSYHSNGDAKILRHPVSKQGMNKIQCDGMTPSGEALLLVASRFPKSLILHFTDGKANGQVTLEEATSTIMEKFPKIRISHIIFHGHFEDKRLEKYRDRVQVIHIQQLQDFAKALKAALEKWFRVG